MSGPATTAQAILGDDKKLTDLADDVIHALCLMVQNKIGQTDGGVAAIYFSDPEPRETVKNVVAMYLHHEAIGAVEEGESEQPRCVTTGQHRNTGRGVCADCDVPL